MTEDRRKICVPHLSLFQHALRRPALDCPSSCRFVANQWILLDVDDLDHEKDLVAHDNLYLGFFADHPSQYLDLCISACLEIEFVDWTGKNLHLVYLSNGLDVDDCLDPDIGARGVLR